jgi:hypothetical protein
VQGAWILETLKPNKPDTISQTRLLDPAQHRFSTLVGLNDDIDGAEELQVGSITLLLPQAGSRQSDSVDAIVPKRMAIAFAFYHYDGFIAPQPPEAIQAGFGPFFPSETIISALGFLESDPETGRQFVPIFVFVWDPDSWRTLVANFRKADT